MKFHIHMLLTCCIYLNNDTDCDRFASISGSVIFRGLVSFQFVDKCYIALHRVWVGDQKYDFCVI